MNDSSDRNFQAAIVPVLSVQNGKAAVAFYKEAFGANEVMYIESPDGKIVAELSIGGARFYVADEAPEHGNHSPQRLGGISIRMGLVVKSPDALAEQAIAAGATEIDPVSDKDYGFRLGRIADPFGHHWEIYRPL
ncbi:VOC family protein [Mucilaginibacter sp.]